MVKKPKGRSVIDHQEYPYERVPVRTPSGKVQHSKVNGDAIATALLGFTREELERVGEQNRLREVLNASALNNGQYRMAVGNRLRAMVRRGEPVRIGQLVITSLDQKVPLPPAALRAKSAKRLLSRPSS